MMLAERKGGRRGGRKRISVGGGGEGVEIKTPRRCCLKVDRRTVFSTGSWLYRVVRLV